MVNYRYLMNSRLSAIVMTILLTRRITQAFLPISRHGGRTFSSSILKQVHGVRNDRISVQRKLLTSTSSTTACFSAVPKAKADAGTESESPSLVPKKFQRWPFQYHEELTLTVEALTNRGIGVCRASISPSNLPSDYRADSEGNSEVEDVGNKGWVVFVPNVIPGEIIKCRIYRNFKSYSEADLIEIVEASPDRVEPVCPLSTECGGCQYQHMNISIQREWKTAQVQELLERVGKLDPDTFPPTKPTVGTDEVYNYRSKITPHYDRPVKSDIGDVRIRSIGFKKKSNRQIIDVTQCHIATDRINSRLAEYREEKFKEALEGRLRRPKKGATLLLRDALRYNEDDDGSGVDDTEAIVETDPNIYVKTMVKDLTFRFLAGNFFQNNPYMLPVMVDHVVEAAIQPNASGNRMTHLIDCYCGSGLFCLSASKAFDVCVGIEVNEKAVEEAQVNADINNISNCKFVAASAEAIFMSKDPVEVVISDSNGKESLSSTLVKDFPKDTSVVVIDPPRKGCSVEFLEQLFSFGPERIVYMSCDPATQARDAESIVNAGYSLTSIQPFDLFPQTRHIESLIIFEKESN